MIKITHDEGVGVTHWLEYYPTPPGVTPWVVGTFIVPNVYGARPNVVTTFGHNYSPSGGRIVSGPNGDETALGWSFEQCYRPNVETSLMEAHLVFVNKDGVHRRPMSVTMDRVAGAISVAHDATRWDLCETLGLAPSVTFYASPGGGGHARMGYPGAGFYVTVANLEAGGPVRAEAGGKLVLQQAPTVTGSRCDNPALSSLITKLAALGIIVDNTTESGNG